MNETVTRTLEVLERAVAILGYIAAGCPWRSHP